jgi:hypothetical protein
MDLSSSRLHAAVNCIGSSFSLIGRKTPDNVKEYEVLHREEVYG